MAYQRGGVKQMLSTTTALVLVLMLLLTTFTEDMGPRVVEARGARICETKSHRFKGLCVSKTNCAHVCQTEGFHGGKCRGFRRRCFCTKPCHHHHE